MKISISQELILNETPMPNTPKKLILGKSYKFDFRAIEREYADSMRRLKALVIF